MSNRYLAVTLAVIACVALAPGPTAAQSSGDSPRTSWGDPDLQGIWNNSTLTPFQRPASLADQEFLTEPPRMVRQPLYLERVTGCRMVSFPALYPAT